MSIVIHFPSCAEYWFEGVCDCIPTLAQGPLLPDFNFRSPAPPIALVPDLEAATLAPETSPIVESCGALTVSAGFGPGAVDPECLYRHAAVNAVRAMECY